jgi:hypothetical protein
MTLIATLVMRNVVVQVSDRRIEGFLQAKNAA